MKKKINLFYSKTNSKTKMNKRKRVVISKKKEETIFSACENGNVEVLISLLIKNGANVNQADNDGTTPLYIASRYGHVEVISLLLNNGANVNQVDNVRRTPLYGASFHDHVEIVSLLLNHGANMYQIDNTKQTPLHIASSNDYVKVVHLLLKFNGKLIFH